MAEKTMKANGINQMRAAVSSPEKAGVGGSTSSLATMFSMSCMVGIPRVGDSWCQFNREALPAAILSNAIALVCATAFFCDSGTNCA